MGSLLLDTIGPHATYIAAVPMECLAFIPLALFPSERRAEARALETSHEADEVNGTVGQKRYKDILKERLRRAFQLIRHDIAPIIFQRSLLLGVASLAIQKLARPMLDLLLQYMSIRFDWSLSKVSPLSLESFHCDMCLRSIQSAFLISIQAVSQIILFLFIVPNVYGWLLKRQNDAGIANLALARLCVTFLILGSLFMALAPAPLAFIAGKRTFNDRDSGQGLILNVEAIVFYTFGTGYPHAMRSFLTSLLPKERITLLYTTMTVFEGLAALVASPLIGLTFSAGINIGGFAVALPFFVAAGLYALAAVGIWLIRPERRIVV